MGARNETNLFPCAFYSIPGNLPDRSSETLGGHIPLLLSASSGMLNTVSTVYTYNGSLPRRRAYDPGPLSAAAASVL